MPIRTEAEVTKLAESMYKELSERQRLVSLTDDYYIGKQRLRFASDQWEQRHRDRYKDFADNWCAPVANSLADRLQINGFRLDKESEVSKEEKQLWDDWRRADMEMQSSQGLLHSITSSRSFVLVWGSKDGEPEPTWERSDQALIRYEADNPRKRMAAIKTWCDDEYEYLNLYWPDVYKLQRPKSTTTSSQLIMPGGAGYEFFEKPSYATDSNPGGWEKREVKGEKWPVPNPMGEVPMVEWAHRPMLGSEPLSEINGVIAMQDAINLLWAYLFSSADFASLPARVVMGQEPPMMPVLNDDGQPTGKFKPLDKAAMQKFEADRILWLTGQNTKIGQFDSADLDKFLSVVETAVTHVAAQTRTPPHYLILGKGMVNVNAEGMKAAEVGLVMKAIEAQRYYGPSAREVFRLMALARGNKSVAEQARLGYVEWKDAENHSEAQLVDALSKLHTIGFPFEFIASRYGLSMTEVANVMKMRKTEAEQDPLTQTVRDLTNPNARAADDSTSTSTE